MRSNSHSLAGCIALLTGCGAGVFANPPGSPSTWTLIWSDEFSGPSLDASKWSWGQLPWGGNHHNGNYSSVITADSSFIWNGALDLQTRPGSFTGSNDGYAGSYSEGMVYSQGKFELTFGYSEISAKFSNASGSWPAFWMLMNGWPPEIDVTEWFEDNPTRLHSGLAFGPNSNSVTWDDTNQYGTSNAADGNWHTWALDWAPGRLATYEDGNWIWGTGNGNEVPNSSMYFILNSGVQTGYNSWWHDDYIDYIRVWKRNQYVYDGDFEYGNGPWSVSGNTGVTAGSGIGGGKAMRLNKTTATDCYTDQLIYGLRPNTDYIFTGWGNVGASYWPFVRVGAKNYGGAEVNSDISSNGFTQATLPFTTGATNTTVDVFAWMPTMWGDTYVDNYNVRPAAALTDRGFESGDTFYYWTGSGVTYGVQSVVNNNARSGGFCLAINGSAHVASGAGQDILGLTPNTTYRFTGWTKNSWQGVRFGVKGFGGTESYTEISADQTYTRGTVQFTTGPTNTTATVYIWYPYTNGWANIYVDDCYLYQPLPATWTDADVGDVVLAGDGGLRNGSYVLQGSGADISGPADAFHYAYQTMNGDGAIIAHVRNMEDTNFYCKAGVMLRENLTAGSRNITAHWMDNRVAESVVRTTTGGVSASSQSGSVTTAPWVRIVRAGNVFTPSYSPDGINWTPLGSPQTIPNMPVTLYAGLAVNSHDTTQMNEASFDNVSVVAIDSDQNGLPDAWEMQYFGHIGVNPNADPDGDGMTNLQESIAGTNPTDPKSRFFGSIARPNAAAPYAITWSSVPGKQYTVLYQNALGGTWQTLATVPAASAPAASTSYIDASSAGLRERFYKIQVGSN